MSKTEVINLQQLVERWKSNLKSHRFMVRNLGDASSGRKQYHRLKGDQLQTCIDELERVIQAHKL